MSVEAKHLYREIEEEWMPQCAELKAENARLLEALQKLYDAESAWESGVNAIEYDAGIDAAMKLARAALQRPEGETGDNT